MRKLEDRHICDDDTDVGVIDDIMRALSPLHDDHFFGEVNAARRGIPHSQFIDEYVQPDTQLIPHRASNRGEHRACFLTLHLSIKDVFRITRVDWSATTIPPTFPSPSSTFRSLNNLHLKFPSHAPHDRNHDSTSRSHQEDLTITISAREISFSTSTDSVSLGNGFTVSSEHRTVTVNYIHTINGDVFSGPISRSNIGGMNNANTIRISSPVGSRSPRLTWSLPRSRHTPLQPEQAESQGGIGRWVQRRSPRPSPY
ncbi:hypothetical protein EYR36_001875 [Pleurotus pulmonarius]|nr:hypothetical protein EYR36_001875 [Pleurotus pulmonarius]